MNVFKVTMMKEPQSGGGYLYCVGDDGSIKGFSNSPKTIDEALKNGWTIHEVNVMGTAYRRYYPDVKPVNFSFVKESIRVLSEAIKDIEDKQ